MQGPQGLFCTAPFPACCSCNLLMSISRCSWLPLLLLISSSPISPIHSHTPNLPAPSPAAPSCPRSFQRLFARQLGMPPASTCRGTARRTLMCTLMTSAPVVTVCCAGPTLVCPQPPLMGTRSAFAAHARAPSPQTSSTMFRGTHRSLSSMTWSAALSPALRVHPHHPSSP